MPGRYIRVRNMAEQSAAGDDIVAVAAAMQVIGASHVETLDTRGIDGSNVMLGGPETITGYFGGIGQPNEYPLRWADEYLRYLTEYGVRQVLNVNPGTVLVALLLHKLGVAERVQGLGVHGRRQPVLGALAAHGREPAGRRRRLDEPGRPQPVELGRPGHAPRRRRRCATPSA